MLPCHVRGVLGFLLGLFCFIGSSKGITGPTHGKVVVCYIGTWAVYRPDRGSFSIEHIDPTLCTHLVYSFAGLNVTESSIRSLDPWQDLTENYGKGGYSRITSIRSMHPNLKITIAIGGWNEGSANYSAMAANPVSRSRFVSSAVEFLKKYNFDGLDLDWEFPGKRGGSPADKTNFVLLVKELRAAFNKYNFLLTAALGAGKDTIDVAYDVASLSVYLDYFHMMCYDYHGAWDQKTGANAPLKSQDVLNVEFTIEYMLQMGAPASKLVMGIPLYGRTFMLPKPLLASQKKPRLGTIARNFGFQGPFTRENGFMGYNEICIELKNTSVWKQFWDDESKTPFAVNEDRLITFDNERSIYEKVKFAVKKGLAGAMVWSMDTDDFQGDCLDETNAEAPINYPLLRGINKAIAETLEDMKHDEENVIHDVKQDSHTSSAGKLSGLHLYNVVLVHALLVCVLFSCY